MKKITLSVWCVIITISSSLAQKTSTKPAESTTTVNAATNLHLIVYRNAIKSGDFATAIVSLNYVVASESKTGKYRDSLAYLYMATQNVQQGLYWSDLVLQTQPNYLGMLEIKANSLKQLGQPLKAIETYEKMLLLDKSPITCFNLTELQYNVKRLYECIASTQVAETLNITKDMVFSYQVTEKETAQTPLMAAFHNYRGLALYDLGRKEEAKAAFNEALKLDSKFLLALSNLLTIEKEEEASKKKETAPETTTPETPKTNK